jgi:hypothetical protein
MAPMRMKVYALLLATGMPVYYARPAGRRTLPRLCFRECQNRVFRAADGGEYLTEIIYEVDAYAATVDGAAALAQAADLRLSGAGFAREASQDGCLDGARKVSMRFRALADAAGNLCR